MSVEDALTIARRRLGDLRRAGVAPDAEREVSEISEESRLAAGRPTPLLVAEPFRAWRLRNAELLTDTDRRLGHDAGGFCVEHSRWLTWREQNRGACSWCVPVDPEREPEYWASHWRTFTGRRS
jgi:hypothetical protein